MIKFVHTADIHLGLQFNTASFDKDRAVERRKELWTTFQNIVKYAMDSDVDFLLVAGDLFEDKYFTLGDMTRVRDILKQAKDVNIIISAGNHDFVNEQSLYNKVEWSPNVSIFRGESIQRIEFPQLNTVIYGYSWDRVEIRENTLLDNFPYEDKDLNRILMIHGDLARESNYLPLNLDTLEKLDMDYIALGHIHKPEKIRENIAYCGCPEPLDFGERGSRGFMKGTISDSQTNVEFVPFSKREFIIKDIIIDEDMGYFDILDHIKDIDYGEKGKDFFRLNLGGYIQNDLDLKDIISSLKEDFYHLEVIDNTVPDYDLEYLEEAYEENIVGQFIKEMKSKDLENPIVKDALYIGLGALLKGRTG